MKLLIFLITVSVCAAKVRYDNHQVYTLSIKTNDQFQVLRNLENNPNEGYLFWNAVAPGQDVDIVVAPYKANDFHKLMEDMRMQPKLRIDNIQKLIDNERPAVHPRFFGWTDYFTLDEIYSWLDAQLDAHPTILTNYVIGTSYQGRPIRAIKLSHKSGNPGFFIEANIHAREWITSATATWWLNELVTSSDPAVRDLAENVDWYIVPVVNVDGFTYAHNTNRLWRKTRYPHGLLCYGTDPNRNFDFNWMANNASDNHCAENFSGPRPFSDPETIALANFVRSLAGQINIYVSFHAFGQFIAFPYSHTTAVTVPHHDDLMSIGNAAGAGFAVRHDTDYLVGTTAQIIYIASGISSDWAYGSQNILVSYTFEMRDRRGGPFGYVLPADQIIDNSLETMDAIIAMVAETRRLGYM